tara:strand:+ start:487 stop:738 length:252 start_codon:yes stop_codon:yes gene_type:complete
MIDRAIKAINTNAQFTYIKEDINSIQWLNGTTPISVSDIQTKIAELPTDEELKQDAITKKASGKQKLLDLGLTEEEVTALIGA